MNSASDGTCAKMSGFFTRVPHVVSPPPLLLLDPALQRDPRRNISPNYKPDVPSSATLACAQAHSLAFKIGGQMFPIDPRDLPSPADGDEANLVTFHYGNLTHPSQDPPRIGFMSQVPSNASALLTQAVQKALADGGDFETTVYLAPTVSAKLEAQAEVTVVASAASLEAAILTATHAVTTLTAQPAAPTASAAPAGKASSSKNGAGRLGIWDPWLLALGAVALSVVVT
ncbi:hypothetical protein K438DRAFT_1966263 [Mycena galopus ATCC 62051]|nr:hypothetical protein K438DRAFT_1966263 [Mycena galopus ATCC 62051]